MRVQVTARHIEMVDSLRDYTMSKIQKLERYFNGITKAEIIFDRVGDLSYSAKLIVGLPRNNVFVSTEVEKTLTAAFDLAFNVMERKLANFKEKLHAKGNKERATRRFIRRMNAEKEPNDQE